MKVNFIISVGFQLFCSELQCFVLSVVIENELCLIYFLVYKFLISIFLMFKFLNLFALGLIVSLEKELAPLFEELRQVVEVS